MTTMAPEVATGANGDQAGIGAGEEAAIVEGGRLIKPLGCGLCCITAWRWESFG